MNHKVKKPHKLLGTDGTLLEPGWATKLIMEYSPLDIKADKIRIKEWDYYCIVDRDGFAFSLTITDGRYMGLCNANFYNLNERKKHAYFTPIPLPMGKMNMPTDSSDGDIIVHKNFCSVSVTHENGGRRLKGKYKKCPLHGELEFDVFLHGYNGDTMVIATPWEDDDKAFYYNQKINCLPADGYVKYDGKAHVFMPEKDFATLDWGRGVWTYDNTWYWSSGNGVIDGKPFGFNLGYGFGNTSAASENMIFYDGKCHKLDRVLFDMPDNIMQPWHIISSDGRFDMRFQPIYDNKNVWNAGLIGQDSHQVFGKFYGDAFLDDGTKLRLNGLTAFAERVRNRY